MSSLVGSVETEVKSEETLADDTHSVFVVQITRHSDGTRAISVRFGGDESDIPETSEEAEGSSSGDAEEKATKSPLRPSLQLARLSATWVNTAIAFFEIVPKLQQENFRMASIDQAEKIERFAEEVNLGKVEYQDDVTSIVEYKIHFDELPIIASKFGKTSQALQAADVMARSALGALVAEYESFIARLLGIVSQLQPNAFLNNEDTISVGDLTRYASIEEAKNAMLAKKIDDLLHRESHVKVIGWIGEKFKVNLTSDQKLVSEFIEICQRRHLLTHAGGFVNQRYLDICSQSGCKMTELPKLGERVAIDPKYLRRATARVFQIGYFTLNLIWQKLIPEDVEKSYSGVLTASHDFLENDLTKMCARLCDFILSAPRRPSERIHAYATVNKALSHKYDITLSERERLRASAEVLGTRDWTIVSPTLELALACVRDELDQLGKLSIAAAADGVTYANANTWVVFRGVRDKSEFMNAFRRPA
jgi:hypothetical protein